MTNPPQPYTIELSKIDSTRAAAILESNTANRNLSQSRVAILSRKMLAGEWLFTGQAHVIISSEGVLLNGQHTLWAVVETGIVIETIVVTGVDPAAFAKIDIGWKRTVGNILSAEGALNGNVLGAIIRNTVMYDTLTLNERGWYYQNAMDADEVVPMLNADAENLSAAASFAKTLNTRARTTGMTLPPGVTGTFYYLAVRQGHDPANVDSFANRVASDTGHFADDPALSLRRWTIIHKNSMGMDRTLSTLSAWTKCFLAAERGAKMSKIYAWTRESPDYPRL
jgi:hypothetical protein